MADKVDVKAAAVITKLLNDRKDKSLCCRTRREERRIRLSVEDVARWAEERPPLYTLEEHSRSG
jgi:hypothetical protein